MLDPGQKSDTHANEVTAEVCHEEVRAICTRLLAVLSEISTIRLRFVVSILLGIYLVYIVPSVWFIHHTGVEVIAS